MKTRDGTWGVDEELRSRDKDEELRVVDRDIGWG